jgi:hypothetical protein
MSLLLQADPQQLAHPAHAVLDTPFLPCSHVPCIAHERCGQAIAGRPLPAGRAGDPSPSLRRVARPHSGPPLLHAVVLDIKSMGRHRRPLFLPRATFLLARSSRHALHTPLAVCPPRRQNPPSGAMDLKMPSPPSSSIGRRRRWPFSFLIPPRLTVSLPSWSYRIPSTSPPTNVEVHHRLSAVSAPRRLDITHVRPRLHHLAWQVSHLPPVISLSTSPPLVTDGPPVGMPSSCRVRAHPVVTAPVCTGIAPTGIGRRNYSTFGLGQRQGALDRIPSQDCSFFFLFRILFSI